MVVISGFILKNGTEIMSNIPGKQKRSHWHKKHKYES